MPEPEEGEEEEKEKAAAGSCLILPGSADPLGAASWGWPPGAGPRARGSCPGPPLSRCARSRVVSGRLPGAPHAPRRGSAGGPRGGSAEEKRGRESVRARRAAPRGSRGGRHPAGPRRPTHRAAEPRAARPPGGARSPGNFSTWLVRRPWGRELSRSSRSPSSPPQPRPPRAAYRRRRRPRQWGAHSAARRAVRTGREGGRGWLRRGPCKGGAPRRRRTARVKASWEEGAGQPGQQARTGKGPCAARPRSAAQLLTTRPGFPGPGSAEPALLPSDSPWGAHADSHD